MGHLFSEDLIELASHSDTDEAETLLESIEHEESARETLRKAKALIKVLLATGVIDEEQIEDLLTPPEDETKSKRKKREEYVESDDDESEDDFDVDEVDDNDDDETSDDDD